MARQNTKEQRQGQRRSREFLKSWLFWCNWMILWSSMRFFKGYELHEAALKWNTYDILIGGCFDNSRITGEGHKCKHDCSVSESSWWLWENYLSLSQCSSDWVQSMTHGLTFLSARHLNNNQLWLWFLKAQNTWSKIKPFIAIVQILKLRLKNIQYLGHLQAFFMPQGPCQLNWTILLDKIWSCVSGHFGDHPSH